MIRNQHAFTLYLLILFVFPTSFPVLGSEDNKDFDSTFNFIATEVMATDITKALESTDSLYKNSINSYQKVKSLMLLATLYEYKGELSNSVDHSKQALKIAKKTKLYVWEARIIGYLASHYSKLELYDEGMTYLNMAKELIPKIRDEGVRNTYNAFLLQEKARIHIYTGEFEDALPLAKEGLRSLEELPDGPNKKIFIIDNYILTGQILQRLEEWNKAKLFFEEAQALRDKENIKDDVSTIFIYLGYSSTNLNTGNFEEAFHNLEEAREILETSNSLFLQTDLYEGYKNYYKKLNDYENYTFYNEKYLALFKKKEKEKNLAIQKFIEDAKNKKTAQIRDNYMLTASSILLLVLIGLIILFHNNKARKNKAKLAKTMNKLDDILTENEQQNINSANNSSKTNENNTQVPEEVRQRILESLDEFEKSTLFLSPNYTLASLSEYVNTNQKYLSHVLNNDKCKNFRTYINDIRIDYIVEKLKSDPSYRNYKISHLSKKCGFSSHSKFSSAFKSATGKVPSIFLKDLGEDI